MGEWESDKLHCDESAIIWISSVSKVWKLYNDIVHAWVLLVLNTHDDWDNVGEYFVGLADLMVKLMLVLYFILFIPKYSGADSIPVAKYNSLLLTRVPLLFKLTEYDLGSGYIVVVA